jgi:hypothetical protein
MIVESPVGADEVVEMVEIDVNPSRTITLSAKGLVRSISLVNFSRDGATEVSGQMLPRLLKESASPVCS